MHNFILKDDKIGLIKSGSAYFDRLEALIKSATSTIHFQVYIFSDDATGRHIANILIKASERGVKVYFAADGYASQDLSSSLIQKMKSAGIYFRYFNPLLKSRYFYFGRRMHHKVIVVDSSRAMVGGINISDKYNDTLESLAWLDWALYVEGNVALQLEKVCVDLRKFELFGLRRLKFYRKQTYKPDQKIMVRINDWVRGRKEITRTYLKMFETAKSDITIISSYLLPGKLIRKYIQAAIKRGVKVKLVMAGISDVTIAKHAERYMYRWLLRNQVQLFEYQKNILHGKLALCDGKWMTLGSYNVNNISAYASLELNLDVHDETFTKDVESTIQTIIDRDCKEITKQEYKSHDTLWNQFLQRSAYDIFRIILFLFTFYFKKQE